MAHTRGRRHSRSANPNFRVERSNGVEATLKGKGRGWSFSLGGYASWFTNYIYEQQTGAVQDDLPVFQSLQAKARYWGVEAEASYKVAQVGGFAVNVDGVGDYTNATIPGVGPVPRIPPLRLLGGVEAQSDKLDARFEVERNFAQDRVAPVETRTAGFTLVNASLAVRPWGADRPISLTFVRQQHLRCGGEAACQFSQGLCSAGWSRPARNVARGHLGNQGGPNIVSGR